MSHAQLLGAWVAVSLLGMPLASARPVSSVKPEEMEAQANLICNGVVSSVKQLGGEKDYSYPNISPSLQREIVMVARIKTLHVFKGAAPSEIEITYRNSADMVPDGAEHIILQKGQRYRFFLKPGNAPRQYVGILNGEFDDNFAVQALCSGEPDDSPYVSEKDAIKIALAYIKAMKPMLSLPSSKDVHGFFHGGNWFVSVSFPSGHSAGIRVRDDRTVDQEQSTIEDERF